jgi:hypothetical protein
MFLLLWKSRIKIYYNTEMIITDSKKFEHQNWCLVVVVICDCMYDDEQLGDIQFVIQLCGMKYGLSAD